MVPICRPFCLRWLQQIVSQQKQQRFRCFFDLVSEKTAKRYTDIFSLPFFVETNAWWHHARDVMMACNELRLGLGLGLGLGLRLGLGLGLVLRLRLRLGLMVELGLRLRLGLMVELGSGLGLKSGLGLGFGLRLGLYTCMHVQLVSLGVSVRVGLGLACTSYIFKIHHMLNLTHSVADPGGGPGGPVPPPSG